MIDEADWSRLARYFAGECAIGEANETRAWIDSTPQRREAADRLREVWQMSAMTPDASRTDSAWQRMMARMHVTEGLSSVALHENPPTVGAPVQARRPRWAWRPNSVRIPRIVWQIASIVVVAIALAEYLEFDVPSFAKGPAESSAVEADRVYRTARGQRAVVTLSDGSRVELGTESTIRVRPFRDGAREVELEGQAIFDVVHDTTHAFLVYTKNAVTEDLGTRFAIRAYPADKRVQVLVTHGKVALRAVDAPAGSGTLLGVLDLGVLDAAGQTTVRNGVDTTSYFAWTRDRFVFDNAPLSEVLPEIARWFDVTIEVDNPAVRQRRVTMNVPASSLRSVLGAATLPLGLRFTVSDRAVVIR